jgi:glycerol-3-phosphate dehydrogenase
MKRELSTLGRKNYDVIVIGAGAFGSCLAWEAASRGLSVAVVDRADFCSATSANHLKMVHGGIRYLQHMDIYRVRESSHERTVLLRIAPHLVQPIPIILPTFDHKIEGKEILALGFLIYDLITLDRNRGIKDSARKVPNGRILNRKQSLNFFPQLSETDFNGAGIFYDGQFYNPPRLALSFLRSAVCSGADIGNYLEVQNFMINGNCVYGVEVEDKLSGKKIQIRGKIVINTTGPWANHLLRSKLGICLKPEPKFSRDLGFVIKRQFSKKYALGVRINIKDPDALLSRKGRHIFLVPWRDYTLVGVWHLVFEKKPDEITVSKDELQSYLDEINTAIPRLDLKLDDISMVNTGLTLFGDNVSDAKDLSFGKRSILIDHLIKHKVDGLITLIGVRATTARGMAEKTINLAFRKLGKKLVKSKTHKLAIYGAEFDQFQKLFQEANLKTNSLLNPNIIRSLLHNYGARYYEVLKYIKEDSSFAETVENSQTIKAEIIHAVREEMAVKLGDVIYRRTDIGTGEYPSENAVRVCAELMGKELGWGGHQTQCEIEELKNYLFLKI